jgi:Pyridoxamine 5'-phosphate oxidase
MHLQRILTPLAAVPLVLSAPLNPQSPLGPFSDDLNLIHRIPTRYESTVLGRRLLALSTTGVISTLFPANNESASSRQAQLQPQPDTDPEHDPEHDAPPSPLLTTPPASVASLPISLPDYLADCDSPSHGNPTLLFLDPSTASRNTLSSTLTPHHPTNISLSLSWWHHASTAAAAPRTGSGDTTTTSSANASWSPASLPRLSLIGYVEEIPLAEAREQGLVRCFVRAHPDARLWLPGDERAAHAGRWVRMVVREVYWIGGFGDRAFIGWLDVGEWNHVSRVEWERVRLPGENEG